MGKKKNVFSPVIFALILSCFLYSVPCHASGDTLHGEPFSHTTETIPMPEEWKMQPIQYEDWAQGADLAVTLDQHLYPILLPVIKEYAKGKNLDISVKEGTCGISAGMLSKKTVDMAGFCCPPGRSDRLPGLRYHTVGIAPLAIIVHPENPTEDITESRVRQLLAGGITNWMEIKGGDSSPGPDMTVRPVARLHCKARPGHWRLILDNEDLFSPDLQEVGSITDMLINVSSMRGSIGHIATWNIHRHKNDWKVKSLRINGVSPYDGKALEEGRYPFYRAYNITTWGADPLAQDLARHLLRHAGDLDREFGMVPSDRLKNAGWKFINDELAGEPE
jgi:ABC-type phosphate transport system substrate-binding protein